MNTEDKPYKVVMTKFLGSDEDGSHTYEITFNQSIVHTGRWIGIEQGLDAYRAQEKKEYEDDILKKAHEIRSKNSKE